jgi:hypothetical protein
VDFEVMDANWLAWTIFARIGPADWVYTEVHDGKYIIRKPLGIKSTELVAALDLYSDEYPPASKSSLVDKIKTIEHGFIKAMK